MNNDATVGPEVRMRDNMRGARYGEIFVITGHLNHLRGSVYNTLGLNDCPQEQWNALDPDEIKKEANARAILMNGPRYFLMDKSQIALENPGDVVSFGGLQFRKFATIRIPLTSMIGGLKRKPYTEHTIERTTSFVFSAGKPVYELVAPDGTVYVMQSYALIVDPTLTEESLATLASRLTLPEQWHYRVRTLDQEYVMQATGEVQVIQDDLENTYQRANS
jgi:haloalkane dehalogenase